MLDTFIYDKIVIYNLYYYFFMWVENWFKEIKQEKTEKLNYWENNERLIAEIKKIENWIKKARAARKLWDQNSWISQELDKKFTNKLEEAYTIWLELSKKT